MEKKHFFLKTNLFSFKTILSAQSKQFHWNLRIFVPKTETHKIVHRTSGKISENLPLDTYYAFWRTQIKILCRCASNFRSMSNKDKNFFLFKTFFFLKKILRACRKQFWQPCPFVFAKNLKNVYSKSETDSKGYETFQKLVFFNETFLWSVECSSDNHPVSLSRKTWNFCSKSEFDLKKKQYFSKNIIFLETINWTQSVVMTTPSFFFHEKSEWMPLQVRERQ